MKEVDCMSNQDTSLVSEFAHEYLFEDFLLDIGIEGRYGVIHQHDGPVRVHSSCETYSCFLTSGQIDTFFTNFCHVTSREDLQVSLELTHFDCLFVLLLVEREAEEDVISDGLVLDPWILLNIGNLIRDNDRGVMWMDPPPSMKFNIFLSYRVIQLFVTISCKECGVYVLEVPNNGIEKRALAGANIANDAYELALFDAEVNVTQCECPCDIRVIIHDWVVLVIK